MCSQSDRDKSVVAQDRELIVSERKLEHALGRRLDARVVRTILAEIEPAAPEAERSAEFYERQMQSDWFVREVKRCREIRMPLGCCEDWPECSHVLAWLEERDA